jgi:hypothetical protein
MGADVRACPLTWPISDMLRALPCVSLEVGDLRGQAQRTQHMLWLALGASARLESWLQRAWALELEPSVARLFRDDRFVVDPRAWAHDVPELVLSLRFGLVFRPK